MTGKYLHFCKEPNPSSLVKLVRFAPMPGEQDSNEIGADVTGLVGKMSQAIERWVEGKEKSDPLQEYRHDPEWKR